MSKVGIKKGDKVKIEYTGTLEDGTVFDASEKHGHPLEFEAGSGMIIPGLDKAIIGMEKDQEKEVTIKPEEAYGDHNPELIKKLPKEQVPVENLKEGMVLLMGAPTGQQIPATVKEVTDTEVTLDINHPLAAKTLKFKVKVVEIESSS